MFLIILILWLIHSRSIKGLLKIGDVVNIPANVKHWHGAVIDSWFSHIAVEVDGTETSNEWLEPVADEVYNKL